MPPKYLEANVVPKLLIWARESVGMDIETVARKLKESVKKLSEWESGVKKPTLIQAEKLAKIYRRPLAVFFLPTPPKEPPLPTDFRTLPLDQRKPFSVKTRLAMRRAHRLQSLAIELAETLNRDVVSKIGKIDLSEDPEIVATGVRKQLGIEIQIQFDWKNEKEAFEKWIKIVEEKCSILVFQMSLPLEETRGFSLTEAKIPAIVLNLKDSTNGRIFSLFHEYAHLLIHDGGICDMGDQNHLSGKAKVIEKFCNHFSGAFLVPKDSLLNHQLIKLTKPPYQWSDEILKELAKDFKVSQEVILRRLVILNKTSVDFYKRKREEWQGKEWQKGWGRKNPPKKCIVENGIPFVSLVLDANRQGKITYSDISDYLAIRIRYLPKIEQLIGSKA